MNEPTATKNSSIKEDTSQIQICFEKKKEETFVQADSNRNNYERGDNNNNFFSSNQKQFHRFKKRGKGKRTRVMRKPVHVILHNIDLKKSMSKIKEDPGHEDYKLEKIKSIKENISQEIADLTIEENNMEGDFFENDMGYIFKKSQNLKRKFFL